MDPVHESGPWTRSKEVVHGPLVHVLSSPRLTFHRAVCITECYLYPVSCCVKIYLFQTSD